MKFCIATLVSFLSIMLCGASANAEIKPIPGFDYLGALFPNCTPQRCVIKEDNYGGYIMPFETAMKQMVERGIKRVEVDAICNSMCASILDRVRKEGVEVCMTPRGEFGFHKMMLFKTDGNDDLVLDEKGKRIFDRYDEPIQTPEILRWIKDRGGAPVSSLYKTNLHLTAKEAVASKLFAPCSTHEATAK
jgi:hypothetical protein